MILEKNKSTDIYIDQINILTLITILFKIGRKKIHRIFYDSYYLPRFLDFIWGHIKLKNINKIPISYIKLDQCFFYKVHWEKTDEFLKNSFSEKNVFEENSEFLEKNKIDVNNYSKHLRDQNFMHAYLPIKLILYSKRLSKEKKNCFYYEQ